VDQEGREYRRVMVEMVEAAPHLARVVVVAVADSGEEQPVVAVATVVPVASSSSAGDSLVTS
jgi:hypothetical protein